MKHVMMLRALGFLLPFVVASCVSAGQESADAGDGDGSGATPYQDPPAAAGVGCREDPTTGVSLCKGISTCPGIEVNPDTFPDCGFRVNTGNTLDIECSCSGLLCAVGVATTCAQAKALLAAQDVWEVCAQVSEGVCTGGGSSSKPDAASACNQECYAMCVGDPVCVKLCGC
jgi:hypothetical protein